MMRVLTWNMGCATKRYYKVHERAWRFLLDLGADITLVQEAMLDVPAWVADQGKLFIEPAYADQRWGSGVLIRGLPAVERPVSVDGSFVTAVDVEDCGQRLLAASIHVCPKTSLARNVVTLGAKLAPLLRGRRFIVGGDLNSSRHFDAVYRRKAHSSFLSEMASCGAQDCLFALHGRETRSYWGSGREYQLDHLFVDTETGSRVRDCAVVTTAETRELSDHSPVVLDLG